jgi:hypothetical protein
MNPRRWAMLTHVGQAVLVVGLCIAAATIVLAMLGAATAALGNF